MPMFGVLYDSAWPLLCTVVLDFFYLQDIVVPAEEALLEKSFGAEWEAYKAARPPLLHCSEYCGLLRRPRVSECY